MQPAGIRKAVVVHAGSRDHYQVALALAEEQLLERLITEFYFDPNTHPWTASFLEAARSKAATRYANGLPGRLVISDYPALAWKILELAGQRRLWAQNGKARSLAHRAARHAVEKGSSIFAYSTCAHWIFPELSTRQTPLLLFQMHPDPTVLKQLFTEELDRTPTAHASLMQENEMSMSVGQLAALASEADTATHIAVASTFTKQTLISAGIVESRIAVIPYGVDTTHFCERPRPPIASGPLKLVFLGSAIQRKGLSYLLDATSAFRPGQVELTILSRGYVDRELLRNHADDNVTLIENLSRAEVVQCLQQSDLFVMPSLAEGFGLAISEAMAVGLPVLTSVNTCGLDLIEDGVEGFLSPIRDTDFIISKIEWGLDHRDGLAEMGLRASERVRRQTWPIFRQGVRDFYKNSLVSIPG